MEDSNINNDKVNHKKLNLSADLKFSVFRIVFAIILILSLTVIKFVFKNVFSEVKNFYDSNISINISADYFNSLGGNNSDD